MRPRKQNIELPRCVLQTTVERKGTFKVSFLRQIEERVQKQWDDAKLHEIDATPDGSRTGDDEKFFTTFPFPYMNGRLHLGHTFSLSKCEVKILPFHSRQK